MGRKSTVDKTPEPVRNRIDRFLRENRMTIAELRAALVSEFGAEAVPSTSALTRYKASTQELVGRMREIDTAARVVVSELGENPDDRAGGLLAHAITALATNAAMRAQDGDEDNQPSIKEIALLARAARNASEVRKLTLDERQRIEKAAEERLVREQKNKLGEAQKSGLIDEATVKRIREQLYGIYDD